MNAKYSPLEEQLIKILRKKRGKPITTLELIEEVYPDPKERPAFPRHVVSSMMNRLIKKVKSGEKEFKINCTERAGPYPIQYWI